jgi:hypothetical protein
MDFGLKIAQLSVRLISNVRKYLMKALLEQNTPLFGIELAQVKYMVFGLWQTNK